jgi:hypothetical protein
MLRRLLLVLLAAAPGSVACSEPPHADAAPRRDSAARARADSTARARQDSINRAQPGYIVDSILPVAEELRRFRADIPTRARRLEHGAPSIDSLVARFADALARHDTTALARLAVTRSEFAYLIYPSSRHARAPYRQKPQIAWMLLQGASNQGATRLLGRLAGAELKMLGHHCIDAPEVEENNRLWQCSVRSASAGETTSRRLFGAIVERDGRFKFLSFANDF